eukprot:GHVU01139323.1.p2 GENE.GHVU01139323.1~~GHVU01139323.1.p2  ORF type:complete len:122 (+),score=7.27 GHVU01139323.1:667-1032(+)
MTILIVPLAQSSSRYPNEKQSSLIRVQFLRRVNRGNRQEQNQTDSTDSKNAKARWRMHTKMHIKQVEGAAKSSDFQKKNSGRDDRANTIWKETHHSHLIKTWIMILINHERSLSAAPQSTV